MLFQSTGDEGPRISRYRVSPDGPLPLLFTVRVQWRSFMKLRTTVEPFPSTKRNGFGSGVIVGAGVRVGVGVGAGVGVEVTPVNVPGVMRRRKGVGVGVKVGRRSMKR